jgi:Ca2+-binding RTX toxin-like protein
MAAPIVSGAIAVIQEAANDVLGRSLSVHEVKDLLTSTGVSIYDGDDESDPYTPTSSYYERIDLAAAVQSITELRSNNLGYTVELVANDTEVADIDFGNAVRLTSLSSKDEMIIGSSSDDNLVGGLGADEIYGGLGNDEIVGGMGTDILSGGGGADIIVLQDFTFDDSLSGGAGFDTLDLSASTDPLNLNLNNFSETFSGSIAGFEKYILPNNATTFTGTDAATTLKAAGNSSSLFTGAGDDEIHASGYNQLISTGSGGDSVYFSGGASQFTLSDGADNLSYKTTEVWQDGFGLRPDYGQGIYSKLDKMDISGKSKFASFVSGGSGTDTITLSNFADVIHIDGSDNAKSFTDLSGLDSENRLSGIEIINTMGGDDIVDLSSPLLSNLQQGFTVKAGSGSDTVFGSSNSDTIEGGAGNDTLAAGPGDNTLTGGAGADTFIFSHLTGSDTVTAFNTSEDIIKILTERSEKPDKALIEKTESGYLWQFDTTELVIQVAGNNAADANSLNIDFEFI